MNDDKSIKNWRKLVQEKDQALKDLQRCRTENGRLRSMLGDFKDKAAAEDIIKKLEAIAILIITCILISGLTLVKLVQG